MLKSRVEYYFYEVFCAPAMSLLLDEGCSRELGTVIEGEGLRQDRLRLAIEFLNYYREDIIQHGKKSYMKDVNLYPPTLTGKFSDYLVSKCCYYQAIYEEQLRTSKPYRELSVNKLCKIFAVAVYEPTELIVGYARNVNELLNIPEGREYAFYEYHEGICHANIDARNIDQYLLRKLYRELLYSLRMNVKPDKINRNKNITMNYARQALKLSEKYAEKEARGETIEEPMVESVE